MKKLTLFLITTLFFSACKDVKRDQYIAEGFSLFQTNCANCHQEKGGGLAGLYPVITKEYISNSKQLACFIKYGINKDIVVNGKHYNRPMPANKQLKDIDIAEIITYLQNFHQINTNITSIDSVRVWTKECEE